jgi:hypothetical protein
MKKEFDGHTIEVVLNGTGSVDPWSCEFAKSIDLGIMCTSDLGYFMLIDGSRVYKIKRSDAAMELKELLAENYFDCWEEFEETWLKPHLEDKYCVEYWYTLEESIESLKERKKRDEVWKSFPEKKRREIYEYLKTLSREEKEKWFEEKIKELGL